MEAELNSQYISFAYLNKRGRDYISGGKSYFVSPLPASACQKQENRKIDEIGDVQGCS
jgi:hypothetical protein